MIDKEKFLNLVSDKVTGTKELNDWYINNREWLRASRRFALIILDRLDELDWTQKILAEKMNVSPQQVSKIVKGKENLTLETLCRLQSILDIQLLNTKVKGEDEDIYFVDSAVITDEFFSHFDVHPDTGTTTFPVFAANRFESGKSVTSSNRLEIIFAKSIEQKTHHESMGNENALCVA